MTAVLVLAATALAAVGVLLVAALALRRLALARSEARARGAEERVRPLALLLVEGEEPDAARLDRTEEAALAALLARYARWLSGDARRHVAAFFERTGAVDRTVGELGARAAWRRASAAFALGDMASAGAVAPLRRALDDADRDVRAAAARSLGRLGAVEAVEEIVVALASKRVPRAVAAQALLAIGDAALPSLRALAQRPDADVRTWAVELVGLLGSAADGPALAERLDDASAEVRARAARAVGRVGARAEAEAVRRLLDDRIPFVRVAAAHALADIGDVDASADLLRLARDDAFEPAHAAARALARLDPQAVRRAAGERDHLAEAADLLEVRR